MDFIKNLEKEVGDFPPVEPLPQIDEKPKRRFSARFANPINIPIYLSASYFFDSTKDVIDYHEGNIRRARYGRYDNPTIEYAEAMLAHLDKCEKSLLFPSGMNAITTALFSILNSGDHIIFNSNCYRNISRFLKEILSKYNIDVTGISSLDPSFEKKVNESINERTKIIFLETPSNPHMCMVDLEAISNNAKSLKQDILVIVDATFATPYNYNPILYGADLVIHSCTKYLSGHSDILGGAVAGSSELIEAIRQYRNVLGGISDGFAAYILVRSMMSLAPRMEFYNQSGIKVAKFLNSHKKVKKVYYLGLNNNPFHEYAKKHMKGFGGVICFELDASKDDVTKFIENLKIPYMSTNFGSQFTLIEQYSIFTLYSLTSDERKKIGVSDSLVRMSLGFENPDDIIGDLNDSLSTIS